MELTDESGMQLALELAKEAGKQGEIPVGAVIVGNDGEILARAHNECERAHDATGHAEMLAIARASAKIKRKFLSDATLYVTLEPCPMCASALIHARVGRIVFGTKDPRAGAFGSLLNLNAYPMEFHPVCESGVLETDCADILRRFFCEKRKNISDNPLQTKEN